MRREKTAHIIDLFFAITLFGVFAISAIMVVFLGIKIYETTVNDMSRNFTSRTAVSYIREKLRQSDMEGSVSIEEVDGLPTIVIQSVNDNGIRKVYINSYAGYLREATVYSLEVPSRDKFVKLMELQSFSVRQVATGIYYVTVVDTEGETDFAYISTKCNQKIKGQSIAAPEGGAGDE